MRPANDKLAADILKAGEKEFLQYGYEKSSLRSIASSLGVTTGAIYRYYQDKGALFEAIVKDAADELLEKYRILQAEFAEKPLKEELEGLGQISQEGHNWMFHLIYDHFDAFQLIASCSAGTSYEHYIDQLVEVEVNASIALMEKMEQEGLSFHRMDEELIHILANAMFSGMFETVRHNMPREKAEAYFNGLREFYEAGWNKLLGLS